MEQKIINMTRDELIDFLMENWKLLVLHLPTKIGRQFFADEKYHTVEKLRSAALQVFHQNSLTA
jgi:hypothetical protein